jgi:hypothetical protein
MNPSPHELAAGLEEVSRHLEAEAVKVPAELVHRAVGKVKHLYAELSDRYGPGYAKAIVGAGLIGLPVPVPFSTALTAAPVIAAAEVHRALVKKNVLPAARAAAALTADQIQALAKRFLADLTRGFVGHSEATGDFETLVKQKETSLGRELTRPEYAELLGEYVFAVDRPPT